MDARTGGTTRRVVALVVPSTPMLLPEYAGQQDPVAPIRERCVAELATLVVGGEFTDVVIVTGAERSPRHQLGPLGARIGRALLARAGWRGTVGSVAVPFDAVGEEVADAVNGIRARRGASLLLVVADGTAKRTQKAPGHFDERAAGVDATLLEVLATGDTATLGALEPGLCQDLWLTGRAAFAVLAGTMEGDQVAAEVMWADDPYGVQYVVARWQSGLPANG